MSASRFSPWLTLLIIAMAAMAASAAEVKLGIHNFQVADGYTIQQVAAPGVLPPVGISGVKCQCHVFCHLLIQGRGVSPYN